MKITIIGSSRFKEKKVAIKKELINMGHEPIIHPHYEEFIENEEHEIWQMIENGEHAKAKIQNDYIRWYHNAIMESDAVLVINLKKGDKTNYIGGNTFLEMGFAYVHDKKIFVYNELPNESVCPYLDEIEAFQPIVIDQDLKKVV